MGKKKRRKRKKKALTELVLHPKELGMPPQKILKMMLASFWDHFGGSKCWGGGHSRSLKLRLLRDYSEIRIIFREDPKDRRRRLRRSFQRGGKRRHNLKTLSRCFVCLRPADERHHIIALKHGGDNRKRNIVSLCEGCHNDIHPWMQGNPRQWKNKPEKEPSHASEVAIPWQERGEVKEFVLLALSRPP